MVKTKTFNILLDTIVPSTNPAFTISTNDLNTVKLTICINQDGEALDLTGATVRLAIKKPDRKSVLQDCTVLVPATDGNCEIVLSTQAYAMDGNYTAEVMVYYTADTVAVTGSFTYTAKKGILSDDTIESTNEWQSITQAIADTEAILVDLRETGTGVDAQARADIASQATLLAQKANQSYVDQQISTIGNASPKGTYSSLSTLQTAYPTGTTGIYVTTDTGHWYYWNGSAWTDGGVYQSSGIGIGVLRKENLYNATPNANLYDKTTVSTDKSIDGAGLLQSTTGFSTSNFISVSPSSQYMLAYGYEFAYYDVNKVFISRTVNSVGSTTTTITTPSNAYYIKVANQTVNNDAQMVVSGSALPSAYIPNQSSVPWLNIQTMNLEKGAVTNEKMALNSVDQMNIVGANYTTNLYNKGTVSTDKTVAGTGTLGSTTGYSASDFISVLPSSQYILSYGYEIAYYDINKTFISRTVNSPTSINTVFTTPANAYYVRVANQTINNNEQMLVAGSTLPKTYVPYGRLISWLYINTSHIIDDTGSFVKNNWSGKIWSGMGDSITNQQLWQPYVTARFGLTYENNGISGTTISGSANNSMCNDGRINAIDINSNLVTVMGGTNDWVGNIPLGNITDTTVTTFYGALNIMCQKLLTRFPTARIVLMTPPYGRYKFDGTNLSKLNGLGLTTGDYGNAMIQVARLYGIPCVDIYGNTGWNDYNIAAYIQDDGGQLHPNDAGARRLAEVLIGKLSQLNPVA